MAEINQELRVMRRLHRQIEQLSAPAQRRVMRYLNSVVHENLRSHYETTLGPPSVETATEPKAGPKRFTQLVPGAREEPWPEFEPPPEEDEHL